MEDVRLVLGDCLEVLRGLPAGSADALVTDPPAGIKFMGVGWDSFATPKGKAGHDRSVAWDRVGGNHNPVNQEDRRRTNVAERGRFIDFLAPRLAECLRVCRPGAVALVWALPRTSHWTALAIEEAGWIIEDRVAHLFGQGFPKAKSRLKPAVEDWWLCRKPGPLWLGVGECRIGTEVVKNSGDLSGMNGRRYREGTRPRDYSDGVTPRPTERVGRYPANVCLSCPCPGGEAHGPECPVRLLDEQAGERGGGYGVRGASSRIYGGGAGFTRATGEAVGFGDAGGPSRFFYVAKASKAERDAGLEGLPPVAAGVGQDRPAGSMHERYGDANGSGKTPTRRNTHPTVKPLALMEWLVKLACPEGGLVLDPFLGSGTTAVACVRTGRRCLGVEQSEEYLETARRRVGAERARTPLFNGEAAGG